MLARRLILALLLAVGVSGLFTFWLGKRLTHGRASAPVASMVVATTRDLEAGDILKPADTKLLAWPKAAPLTGSFAKIGDVEGRAVLYPLAAGEPVLDRQLAATGAGAGLSQRIPDGMRAVSLKSDQIVGVAGFLLPGTHVDVLVTLHGPADADPVTATVLQDVRILAAGQKLQPDPDGKATTVDVVTLLVSPQEAERAVLASTQGNIHFVLRNGGDHAEITDKPVELSSLGPAAPRPVAPRPVAPAARRQPSPAAPTVRKPYSVEVVRGDKASVESFQ